METSAKKFHMLTCAWVCKVLDAFMRQTIRLHLLPVLTLEYRRTRSLVPTFKRQALASTASTELVPLVPVDHRTRLAHQPTLGQRQPKCRWPHLGKVVVVLLCVGVGELFDRFFKLWRSECTISRQVQGPVSDAATALDEDLLMRVVWLRGADFVSAEEDKDEAFGEFVQGVGADQVLDVVIGCKCEVLGSGLEKYAVVLEEDEAG